MKKGVAAILILLILPSMGFAQTATNDTESNRGADRIAIIDTGQLCRTAVLELRPAGQTLNRSPNQAQPHSRAGHPVLIDAAIGAGAGYLLNATVCRTGESVCSPPGNLLMAGIGAGIGAFVGVLVSRR